MNRWIPLDSGDVKWKNTSIRGTNIRPLITTQTCSHLTIILIQLKIWLRVCDTVARTYLVPGTPKLKPVFDLVFDAVAVEAVFNMLIAVVDWVTVSMSMISGGTILGCRTTILGGGFEWWDCCCYSLSSTDPRVLSMVLVHCASWIKEVSRLRLSSLIVSISACTYPISRLKESLVELISACQVLVILLISACTYPISRLKESLVEGINLCLLVAVKICDWKNLRLQHGQNWIYRHNLVLIFVQNMK